MTLLSKQDLEAPAYADLHEDYEELWSEILPGLWQGGTADEDVKRQLIKPQITTRDFDTVVTMYAHANPVDWFVREIRYGVWDSDMADFDPEELFDIVDIAHRDWKRGKRVMVRCQAGWNRSGLVTALILIRDGWDPKDAITLIRQKRSPHALCNREFVRYLTKSVNPADWRGASYGLAA